MSLVAAVAGGIMLPTLAGAAVAAALLPGRRDASWLAASLAAGFFLGVAMVGFGCMLGVAFGLDSPRFPITVGLFVVIGAALSTRFWRRLELRPPGFGAGLLLLILLLLLVLPNLYWSAGEILDRPLLGWDAWTVWSAKPKTWVGAGAGIDFVDVKTWLPAADPRLHTTPASHYPELIGRFEYWVATWAGGWNEHLVNLTWVFLWTALIVGFHAFLRRMGSSVPAAAIATLLLATAPFMSVHMAIPGYMDLWIAGEAMLACALLASWTVSRSRGELLMGIALLAMLCATKVEGVIWAGIILVVFAFAMMPGRWRIGSLVGVIVLIATWWLLGGFSLTIADYTVAITPELIDLPYIGRFELGFENRIPPLLQALLVLPNWHVLAGLMALVAAVGSVAFAGGVLKRACYGYLLLAVAFLFVLFNLTPAGMWAESLTASNRLTLQMIPAAAWLLAVNLARAIERSD